MNKKHIKICVPIIGKTKEEIIEQVKLAAKSKADIIEWRVDYYENVHTLENVIDMLKEINAILDDKQLIFTYRSSMEGGKGNITIPEYTLLNKTASLTKMVDYIDIEMLLGDTLITSLCNHAKVHGTKVIISNHDFDSTPRKELIENRLKRMFEQGADYAKGAFMPRNEEDVQSIIDAGKTFDKENIILIGMGELGVKTRLHPETSNSCMTFASLGGSISAPGQVDVEEVYQILNK